MYTIFQHVCLGWVSGVSFSKNDPSSGSFFSKPNLPAPSIRRVFWPLLVVCLGLYGGNVEAARIEDVKDYTEDKVEFEWVFKWDGTIPAMSEPVLPQKPHPIWGPLLVFTDRDSDEVFDELFISAQHMMGPHTIGDGIPGKDEDPGDPVFFFIDNAATVLGSTNSSSRELGRKSVEHKHIPSPNHSDAYVLSYQRAQNSPVRTFTFNGFHEATPIPEPSTLVMLAVGLTGLGFMTRMRRR